MKTLTKQIFLAVALTLVVVYLLIACCFLPDKQQQITCSNIDIVLSDSLERQFLTRKDMYRLLQEKGINPKEQCLANISTNAIEEQMKAHPYLRDVQCYKTTEGKVCVRASQRIPKLRVLGDENYYVDTDRKVMPVGVSTATYVPVITGRVSQTMATTEIYDFVSFLEENPFWNAQIKQIHVNVQRQVELIPTIGDHTIILGTLKDYEQKLERLSIFYKQLAHIGWKDWDEIDLRFNGQVITRTK